MLPRYLGDLEKLKLSISSEELGTIVAKTTNKSKRNLKILEENWWKSAQTEGTQMKNKSTLSFQRAAHDKENPYTIVSRDLIRDTTISPNCRWLIIYLLSMKEDFKISIQEIWKHVGGFIGRDKVYGLVREAIEAGYMKKEQLYKENLKSECILHVAETPIFKKCFRHPDFQYTEAQYPEDQELLDISLKKEEAKEEIYNKAPKSPATSDPASPESEAIYTFFLQSLRKRNSNFKEPNKNKWVIEIDRMLRIDKRDPKEVMEIITWSETARYHKTSCISAEKLRKQYDEMVMKREENKEIEVERENRQYLTWVLDTYKEETRGVSFNKLYVINTRTGIDIPFSLPHASFKEALDNVVRSACIKR